MSFDDGDRTGQFKGMADADCTEGFAGQSYGM